MNGLNGMAKSTDFAAFAVSIEFQDDSNMYS